MKKQTYHHQNLRNEILMRASESIDVVGQELISLRTIAKKIGVSPMAMYHHFKSKQDLLLCLAEQYRSDLDQKINIEFSEDDIAKDKLIAMGKQYIFYAIEYPERFRIMFSATNTLPPHQLMEQQPVLFGRFSSLVIEHFKLKDEKAYVVKIFSIWSSVHGLAALVSTGPLQNILDSKEELNTFIDFHLQAILS